MTRACLLLSLVLMVPMGHADGTPAVTREPEPPGSPYFAILDATNGTGADSVAQRRFHDVLRGVFLERTFATERSSRPGRYEVSVPISNRFVLLEGSGGPADPPAYHVQLTLDWLAAPPAKAGKGAPAGAAPAPRAVVSVFVVPPGVDPAIVRIAPAADTVTFLAPASPPDSLATSVARNAALLALEHLHHLAGELSDDERLRMDRVKRTAPAAPMRR